MACESLPAFPLANWSPGLLWHEQGIRLGLPLWLPGISICLPVHAQLISWFWHMVPELTIYHLEYDNIEPTVRDDCLRKSRICGHLHISKQKKHSKNGFLENDWFFRLFWAVQIYPVSKSLNTSFVNEFIRCFLSPITFMVCPVGEGGGPITEWGHCFRVQSSGGSNFVFWAVLFWAGASLLQVSKERDAHTLNAMKSPSEQSDL